MMRLGLSAVLLLGVACTCSPDVPDAGPTCPRLTCESGMCGELEDGCNGILRCGPCETGLVCGGGGTPNVCGPGTCTPQTCFELGKNCDLVSDRCSKLIDCGRCRRPADCGADGVANICGGVSCVAKTCPPDRCGNLGPDGCHGILVCNVCAAPQSCGGGGTAGVCGCTPKTCASFNAACGMRDDTCGAALACGACTTGRCSVGGAPNTCGECPESNGRVCSPGCWCWESPRLTGNSFSTIWGTGASDVWLFGYQSLYLHAGDGGSFEGWPGPKVTVIESAWGASRDDIWAVSSSQVVGNALVHWDGVGWWPALLSFNTSLRGVWGFAANDVWAVGDSDFVHFDGTTWTRTEAAATALQDVWGAAPNDIWAAAGNGLWHYDGQSWLKLLEGSFFCVRGTARDDAWASTAMGLWHYNGSTWALVAAGSGKFTRLLALARNDVYAARDELLLHFDGMAWTDVPLGDVGALDGLWGSGPDDVWVSISAQLFHKDARGWHALSALAERDLRGVHAVSDTEQWAVGLSGRLLRGDGTRWTTLVSHRTENLLDVAGAGGRVWVVGADGLILSSVDGGAFVSESMPSALVNNAVHAVSASEAYVAGAGTLFVFDGGRWAPMNTPVVVTFESVWASGPGDVWLGEGINGRIFHWDGGEWAPDGPTHPADVTGLWGAGGEVFASLTALTSDGGGLLLRFDGGAWSALPGQPPGVRWRDVWGTSQSDVWFTGSGGTVAHWNGSALQVQRTGVANELAAVSGASGRVWAVGARGVVARVDGTASFEPVEHLAMNDELVGIAGSASDDVWAVGSAGAPRRWNGSTWVTHALLGEPLTSVWATSPGDVWVGTSSGAAHHFDGGTWRRYPVMAAAQPIGELWGAPNGEVWGVGGGAIAHWDGGAWGLDFPMFPPRAVHGTAANDVWAVGQRLLHYNGSAWLDVAATSTTMTAVFCIARDDCWAAGTRFVSHWNGTQWLEDISPLDGGVRDLWGRDKNDVWLFGTDGQAAHWNGFDWSEVQLGAGATAFAAWGSDAGIWAVSGRAVLFHR